MELILPTFSSCLKLKWKAATPAGTARAEDPGLSAAREAAEAVPAESVRLERKPADSKINLSHIFIKNDVSEDPPHLLLKGWGFSFTNVIYCTTIIYLYMTIEGYPFVTV